MNDIQSRKPFCVCLKIIFLIQKKKKNKKQINKKNKKKGPVQSRSKDIKKKL